MLNPRIPEPVRPLLENYIDAINKELPGLIVGFYIVGSIALDGFNEQFSDIDFVAVLDRTISEADLDKLQDIHETLKKDFPKLKLSGSYLPIHDLGHFEDEIKPHPYYQDGKLHEAGFFGINSVTWWELKNHGITVLGKEPADLSFTVDWDLLLGEMKENLNSYWVGWTNRPDRFAVMLSDWGIQWTVLGVLRQYYTFHKNSITTKTKAAEYALPCFPSRWHPLIQEAIDIRAGKRKLHYWSRIIRMIDAVKFLKYVIRTVNAEFPSLPPRPGSQNYGDDMEQSEAENNRAIALNQALIDDLKKKDLIKTTGVESAFRNVLRHLFLPGTPLEEVYSDRAISAKQDSSGQWISSSSQPAIMAIMLEQLGLEPGHKVLEIGTGPGYNAALMAHIVGETGQVVTVEIDEDLAQAAREHLSAAGFEQVQVLCADGGYGAPDAAPFDRIILTVGAPDITPAWWEQLKPNGRLVLPLLLRGSMKSIAFTRADDHLASQSVTDCGFIPLRGDYASGLPNRIQIGPDPDLYMEPMDEFPIDGEAIYGLLTGAHEDWPTGVETIVWDVIGGSLWTWLALHEPRMCKLVAEGGLVERNIVPPILGIDGKRRSSGTAVLLDQTGLAALVRPPDQPLPVVPFEKLFMPDSPANQPFPLYVRQFGSDESVAKRLLAQIQARQAAGSPSSNTMRIRAYPRDFKYEPSKAEILLDKQWTKLVIEWHAENP